MRRITMRKISEVLRQHHELQCSQRDIASSLQISKTTVFDYLNRAKLAGITWPLPPDTSERDLFNRLFLPVKANTLDRPLPDWEWVCREIRKKGMTLRLLWREYRDVHSTGLGYSQFCERYRDYLKHTSPIMRQIYKAGEKAFVDYAGMTVPWIDVITGEIHDAQIFVGAMGASQFTFAEATATQSMPDWILSHIRMSEYFGGVSAVVVPDNLKSGVTKAHRYDPDINFNYQQLSKHYGFAIVPARVREPQDKAKAENAVGCIEKQILAPLRHITFTSLAEINAAIRPRLMAFNQQLFQKMKTSRQLLFDEIDKPALNPLPSDRYQYAEWRVAKINIDYHFVFEDHYYSVPYQYIHQKVELRVSAHTVECFYESKRLSSHPRSYLKYKYSTSTEHMPPAHRAHAEWTPERMKRWANKIGPDTVQFIDHLIASRPFPEQAFRACLGVLRLGSRYGEARLEKACAIAYEAGATRYSQIELILKNKLDAIPHSHEVNTPQVSPHENIRGSDYYKEP